MQGGESSFAIHSKHTKEVTRQKETCSRETTSLCTKHNTQHNINADSSKDKQKPRREGERKRFGPGRLQQGVDDVFNSFGAEILYEDVEAAVRFVCDCVYASVCVCCVNACECAIVLLVCASV